MQVSFAVEKIKDEDTGEDLNALVKTVTKDGEPITKETWCTILDIDKLFGACSKKWGTNWNLEKVCTAIADSEIE